MRSKLYGGIAVLVALVATAAPGRGQGLHTPTGFGDTFGGASSEGLLDAGGLPGLDSNRNVFTAPLGDPGKPGIFAFADMTYMSTTWALGSQTVAWRGLVDTTGQVTGLPGTYLGSGVKGLSTDEFGRRSFMPGVNIGIGYKLDDGTTVTARVMHLFNASYNAGASLASPYARSRADLVDTFLTSGVFNFPPNFAGPPRKTAFEGALVYPGWTYINPTSGNSLDISGLVFTLPNGTVIATGQLALNPINVPDRILGDGLWYGIWNGASNMTIRYDTSYTEAEVGGRVPLFESNTSKIYGLSGLRFHHFLERFYWRTTSYALDGTARPQDSAVYTNTLSQRMYGPYVGCGHEVYLGKRFSLSAEVSAGAFLNIVKERAKYKLEDTVGIPMQNKRSVNEIDFVPTAGGNFNVWWYPVRGVQMRVGYQANTFYNTTRMGQPIGFNYGAIDPVYGTSYFRLLHGVNVGLGIFF
jgi:hypothetical protein